MKIERIVKHLKKNSIEFEEIKMCNGKKGLFVKGNFYNKTKTYINKYFSNDFILEFRANYEYILIYEIQLKL